MVTPGNDQIERWSPFRVWVFGLFHRTPDSNLAAVEWLDLQPSDRFLDIGCCLGAALEQAAARGAAVAGIDPTPDMVKKAAKRVPEAEVRMGNAEEIPFPDDHFTAVMAVATFHHWADRDAGLAEARRVTAPGGRLLLVEQKEKKPGGHGLHPDEANALIGRLRDLGFTRADAESRRVGRHDYYAVTAS